jgi:HAD superfamily phosphoserine phosphatase-like hydrolase
MTKNGVIIVAIVTVDFDGTLYQGNSFKVMFEVGKKSFSAKQWGVVVAGLVSAAFSGIIKGKTVFKHNFFKSFAKTFKGKTSKELDIFFQKLVDIGKADVNLELVDKIREHQKNGDTVIVLSGALQPFLKAFLRELKLKEVHIISTELQYNEKNQCTGKIGQIINGEYKVAKVKEWIEKYSDVHQISEVWAYADSESDIPLLEFVEYPVVVNPKPDMKEIADQNKWPIFAS